MYIKGINGYLSKFEGTEVDAAVERVQNLDTELAQKVSITTKINDIPLTGDITLTAEDIGAIPVGEGYGRWLGMRDDILVLYAEDAITELSTVELNLDRATWGKITGVLTDQIDLAEALNERQPLITPEAMVSADLIDDTNTVHKFASAGQLSQIATNATNIAAINTKIPSQASSSNQLADKNFVNSSIATNTSYFIGTFNSLAELEAYSGTLTNNDYGFVVTVDSAGNTVYNRYKYNSNSQQWLFEYALNNSSFTAEQWASIQSGVTSSDVAQITINKNNIATKQDKLTAGSNIQISNNNVISATDTTYTAGTGISIINNVISNTQTGGVWGSITGTLSNQTDLKNALDSKQGFVRRGSSGGGDLEWVTPYGTSIAVGTEASDWGEILLYDVNNKFIAISNKGYISTSEDGVTWTTPVQNMNLGSRSWEAAAYGNGKFVALGYLGYISTSIDGTTWTDATQNSNLGNHGWNSIIYDGSKFVALGVTGYISTSIDGTTWTIATQNANLGSGYWLVIAYGDGKFVALGYNGTIATSTNSTDWTITYSIGESHNWASIIYYGGKFIVFGRGYKATSVDLVTWNIETFGSASSGDIYWEQVAFSNDRAVVIGYDYIGTIASYADIQVQEVETTYTNIAGDKLNLEFSDYDTYTLIDGETGIIPDERISSNIARVSALSSYATQSWVENKGYITGITSGDVTTALGYTPYSSANPNGYISSAALATLTDVSIVNATDGQHLTYDSSVQKWTNSNSDSTWGHITGTLSNQTDLQTALDGKQATITGAATTITSADLTADRVVVSNSSGKIEASPITTTKLGYLSGVTSSIQSQLNNKYDASNPSKYISNTADPEEIITANSLGILGDVDGPNSIVIGSGASSSLGPCNVVIGNNSKIGSTPTENSVAIGYGSQISSFGGGIALGYNAKITGKTNTNTAIQIGEGTNSTASTLNIGFGSIGNYQLLDGTTGLIPDARLSTNIVRTTDLATVATSGSYNDLTNKPIIPAAQVQSDWDQTNTSAVDFIKNKPTIPAAQIQSDWDQTDTSAVDYIKNKPTIPAEVIVDQTYDPTSVNAQSGVAIAGAGFLNNVTLNNVANGETLIYNSASGKWENAAVPAGSSSLSGLTDVSINTPYAGQTLIYDSTTNKWINSAATATVAWGGIVGDINDQLDLKNALGNKASVTFRDWSVS